MKGKNILIIVVLIALGGVAAYFATQDKGTIKQELKDFAVKDTSLVTKIFMADKANNKILLERKQGGTWRVNENIIPRKDAVDVLLSTLSSIQIKSPVSKTRFKSVINQLASDGIKVEIYQGGEQPHKVYFVGSANQDHTGTYMLQENSSTPFLMHIEGFYGHLRPRYFVNENAWKSTILYSYAYGDIENIEVTFPKKNRKGYTINAINNDKFELKDKSGNIINNVDVAKLLNYVSSFQKIHFESFEETRPQTYADSLNQTLPESIITVTDNKNNKKSIKLYQKPLSSGPVEYEGDTINLDIERMHGIINDNDFVVAQYHVFDPLTVDISYFMIPAN